MEHFYYGHGQSATASSSSSHEAPGISNRSHYYDASMASAHSTALVLHNPMASYGMFGAGMFGAGMWGGFAPNGYAMAIAPQLVASGTFGGHPFTMNGQQQAAQEKQKFTAVRKADDPLNELTEMLFAQNDNSSATMGPSLNDLKGQQQPSLHSTNSSRAVSFSA